MAPALRCRPHPTARKPERMARPERRRAVAGRRLARAVQPVRPAPYWQERCSIVQIRFLESRPALLEVKSRRRKSSREYDRFAFIPHYNFAACLQSTIYSEPRPANRKHMLPRWRQVALAGVHAAARPHGGRRRWARRLQDLNFNGV